MLQETRSGSGEGSDPQERGCEAQGSADEAHQEHRDVEAVRERYDIDGRSFISGERLFFTGWYNLGVSEAPGQFLSRAGQKLDAALDAFGLDVAGLICADFGCNVGGFTDCLLQRGAGKVYAVDTGYGELAWKLRKDSRVVVMERTNALYTDPPQPVDLVTIDVGWTPQELIVPPALQWIGSAGRIVSLLKPHYELSKRGARKGNRRIPDSQAREVCLEVSEKLANSGCCIQAEMRSVLRGKGGNLEFFLLLSVSARGDGRDN